MAELHGLHNLQEITENARSFMESAPLNIVTEFGGMRIFDEPIFRIAAAADPLFAKLKDPAVIGPHHLNPEEWLPGARSVISYFLPFTAQVREANRTEGDPALEWLYGRVEGQAVNDALCRHLFEEFKKNGVGVAAPSLDKRFALTGKRSNWSERHAAFIAGLGTFNLSKSMITEKGCAGRFGSVIVDRAYEVTPRPYTDIYEYCTNCGICIDRCPPKSISFEQGKDHESCSDFVYQYVNVKYAPRFGCGKCQTAVPCEYCIP